MPVIDMIAVGVNIEMLRKSAGLTVKDVQDIFGFSPPQAIYKWQCGTAIPAADNLVALAAIFGVTPKKARTPTRKWWNGIHIGLRDRCRKRLASSSLALCTKRSEFEHSNVFKPRAIRRTNDFPPGMQPLPATLGGTVSFLPVIE